MDNTQQYVKWFRNASPYINAHRGKTFVFMLGGETVDGDNFATLIHDIALLNSLGVRMVISYGARPQIDRRLKQLGSNSRFHRNRRVTDNQAMTCAKEALGVLQTRLQAALSTGLPNSPMHGAKLRVCSGNFITAKPLGIIDGIDFQHTGEIRRVDCEAINHLLDNRFVVLLPPLGYSPSGEAFNLTLEDVAGALSTRLKADKLILFGEDSGVLDSDGKLLRELTPSLARNYLRAMAADSELYRQLEAAIYVAQSGVPRAHLISHRNEGALLQELFTVEGAGTLITQDASEHIRSATIDDIGGILELIQPLEEDGTLVRRSREMLENEISQFTIMERDGMIVALAALYPYPEQHSGELACVVTHPDYRHGNRGAQLLQHIEKQAAAKQLNHLFVLTTRTAHWFIEQGFQPADIGTLPQQKQALYNYQRNSKVFVKAVGG